MPRLRLLAALLCLQPPLFGDAVLRVPEQYATIQDAVDAGETGDTVLVASGEYLLASPVRLEGKGITLRSEEGSEQTILRLEESPEDPLHASVIAVKGNPYIEALIEGFTITGGRGGESDRGIAGGGILVRQADLTLRDCRIRGNLARDYGGGAHCESRAKVRFESCIIAGNAAQHGGGGIFVDRTSTAALWNCTVSGNSSTSGGGVFAWSGSLVDLDHSTISGNSSYVAGGIHENGKIRLANSIVWDNQGGSFEWGSADRLTIRYSCIEGPLQPTVLPREGIIEEDPLFEGWGEGSEVHVDSGAPAAGHGAPESPFRTLADALDYSYALSPRSPCIGRAEDGTDIGARHGIGRHSEVEHRTVHLAPGEYAIHDSSLAHRVSLVGSGAANTRVWGTVFGLSTGMRLEELTVSGGQLGGAVIPSEEDPTLRSVVIADNQATTGGGIFCQAGSRPLITGCVITRNVASTAGGAVYCEAWGSPVIEHTTISGNVAPVGGGIYRDAGGPVIISSSILWNNPGGSLPGGSPDLAEVRFSCTDAEDAPPGPGNIAVDPRFCGWSNALLHVDAGAAGPGDGSEDTPFGNVQTALAGYRLTLGPGSPCLGAGENGSDMGALPGACPEGGLSTSLVLLAPGEYDEGSMVLAQPVDLAGSSVGSTTLRGSLLGPRTGTSIRKLTITGSDHHGVVISGDDTPTLSECVITAHGSGGLLCAERAAPILSFCEITGNRGPGVTCRGDSGPLLERCVVAENTAGDGGGAFCADGSSPRFHGCELRANVASGQGGGILVADSAAPVVEDCRILGNRAAVGGGACFRDDSGGRFTKTLFGGNAQSAIVCTDSVSPVFSQSEILANWIEAAPSGVPASHHSGGGIRCAGSSTPSIVETTISRNWAQRTAGGLAAVDTSRPEVRSCTIAGNSAPDGGGAHIDIDARPLIRDSILWANAGGSLVLSRGPEVDVSYCCIESDAPWPGVGNLNDDPRFCGWGVRSEVFVDPTAPGAGTGAPESPFATVAEALAAYSLSPARDSPCVGAAEEGGTLGACDPDCNGAPRRTPTLHLLPGEHAVEQSTLAFGADFRGEGADKVTIRGTVRGLLSGSTLSGVTVTTTPGVGILVERNESTTLEQVHVKGCGTGGILGYRDSQMRCLECVIEGTTEGVGVQGSSGARLVLEGCKIRGNNRGGVELGIHCDAVVTDCLVAENWSGDFGMGFSCRGESALSVVRCVVRGHQKGAAVFLKEASTASFSECVFRENSGTDVSVLRGREGSSAHWSHCTVSGNLATRGAAVRLDKSTATVESSIFWSNGGAETFTGRDFEVSVMYSDIEGTEPWPGTGNIAQDPRFCGWTGSMDMFVDPGAADGGDGTQERPFTTIRQTLEGYSLSLAADSPCLGAGESSTDMGADTGRCSTSEVMPRTIRLAGGEHVLEAMVFSWPFVLRGEADGSSVLRGDVTLGGRGTSLVDLTLQEGALIVSSGTSPDILRCTISGARDQAVTIGPSASPRLVDTVFRDNVGRAVWVGPRAGPTFDGCTFEGNEGYLGGALWCATSSSPTLHRCLLRGNRASERGGAIWCQQDSLLRLTRSTVVGNVAPEGGGVDCGPAASIEVTESILWDNAGGSLLVYDEDAAVVRRSCIEGPDLWPGPGNIRDDPRFCGWGHNTVYLDADVEPGGNGTEARPFQDLQDALSGYDLSLASDSPCRGAAEDGGDLGRPQATCDRQPHARRVIHAAPGVYDPGRANLAHRVSLEGSGAEETVIVAPLLGLRVGEHVQDLQIQGSPSRPDEQVALGLSAGEAAEVLRCTISGSLVQRGIHAASAHAVLDHCVITDCVHGISLHGSSRAVIRDCKLVGNRARGLSLRDAAEASVERSTFDGNGGGASASNQSTLFVTSSSFRGQKTSGIWIGQEARFSVRDTLVAEGEERGVVCASSVPAALTGCTIRDNSGGGLFTQMESVVRLERCALEGNTATEGGAVWAAASSRVYLEDCVIRGNRATRLGGGILADSTEAVVLDGCLITGNVAQVSGGGLHIDRRSRANVDACSLTHNVSVSGGGVFVATEGMLALSRTTAAGNSALNGGALSASASSTSEIASSILWYNALDTLSVDEEATLLVRYSSLERPKPWPGEGNIAGEPLFCGWPEGRALYLDARAGPGGDGDPESPWASLEEAVPLYDFRLSPESPCLGAGEGGSDMGAPLGIGGEAGPRVIRAHLAPGTYPAGEWSLALGISLLGAGEEKTRLIGPLRGPRSGTKVADLEVVGPQREGLVIGTGQTPRIHRCAFTAPGGEAILCLGSASPRVHSCRVYKSRAGVAFHGESRGTFEALEASGNIYGIYCMEASAPRFVNCIVIDSLGQGLHATDNSTPSLVNCLITENLGTAVVTRKSSSPELTNSIVWGNRQGAISPFPPPAEGPAPRVRYSCIQGDEIWPGEGNIHVDPRFRDAQAGDYRLLPDSPCVDAGILTEAPDEDIDGLPRPCGRGVDLGPHEMCEGPLPSLRFRRGDVDGDGGLDMTDPMRIILHLLRGYGPFPCEKAADIDDDGTLAIDDALRLLDYLYGSGAPPGAPFEQCGEDPSEDALGCRSHGPCL